MIKENVIDLGFAGWMADFGEYTPLEGRSGFGARWWGQDKGEVLHQVISQEWARLNREVVEENGHDLAGEVCLDNDMMILSSDDEEELSVTEDC